MKRVLIVWWLLTGTSVFATAATEGFERYAVILERQPFGDPPIATAPELPPLPPADSVFANYRVCSITERENDGAVRVGLVEKSTNKSYLLAVGDEADGIMLVSASFPDLYAILQMGEETVRMDMNSGEVSQWAGGSAPPPIPTAPVIARPTPSSSGKLSYTERRKQRLDEMRQRQEEAMRQKREEQARQQEEQVAANRATPMSPEEVRARLGEANMAAIRNGFPPLPIELTEEQDRLLVAEGFLPPLETGPDGGPPPNLPPAYNAPPLDSQLEDQLLLEAVVEELGYGPALYE